MSGNRIDLIFLLKQIYLGFYKHQYFLYPPVVTHFCLGPNCMSGQIRPPHHTDLSSAPHSRMKRAANFCDSSTFIRTLCNEHRAHWRFAGAIHQLTGLSFLQQAIRQPARSANSVQHEKKNRTIFHVREVQWRPLANLMKRKQIRTSPINTFLFFFVSMFLLNTWQALWGKRGRPLYIETSWASRAPAGRQTGPNRVPVGDHTRGVPEKWPSSSAVWGLPDKFVRVCRRFFFWSTDSRSPYLCRHKHLLTSRWRCQKCVGFFFSPRSSASCLIYTDR